LIVLGDARLSLERELEGGENQEFDLFAVDAFSSDSIPIHLITKEAFAIYLEHLKPGGVLAVHISNKHLKLEAVVAALAQEFDLAYAIIDHKGDGMVTMDSTWVLLSKDQDFIDGSRQSLRRRHKDYDLDEVRIWTDDYSNLFSILK